MFLGESCQVSWAASGLSPPVPVWKGPFSDLRKCSKKQSLALPPRGPVPSPHIAACGLPRQPGSFHPDLQQRPCSCLPPGCEAPWGGSSPSRAAGKALEGTKQA